MLLNSLINFFFDGGESRYLTANIYGACWEENIKDKVICLNKWKIKDAVPYLNFNRYFTVGTKIIFQIIFTLMGSDPTLFLSFYCYTFRKVNR